MDRIIRILIIRVDYLLIMGGVSKIPFLREQSPSIRRVVLEVRPKPRNWLRITDELL